jgi:hypothetical protein
LYHIFIFFSAHTWLCSQHIPYSRAISGVLPISAYAQTEKMEVNQHNTLLRNKNGTNSLDTRIHKVKTFRMQKTTKKKKYIYINKNHSPLQ